MACSWRKSMATNSTGGLRGPSKVAALAVAGTIAYFLWVKPSQRERAALAAASGRCHGVEKRKPMPDPQETGLIYGNKSRANKPEN